MLPELIILMMRSHRQLLLVDTSVRSQQDAMRPILSMIESSVQCSALSPDAILDTQLLETEIRQADRRKTHFSEGATKYAFYLQRGDRLLLGVICDWLVYAYRV